MLFRCQNQSGSLVYIYSDSVIPSFGTPPDKFPYPPNFQSPFPFAFFTVLLFLPFYYCFAFFTVLLLFCFFTVLLLFCFFYRFTIVLLFLPFCYCFAFFFCSCGFIVYIFAIRRILKLRPLYFSVLKILCFYLQQYPHFLGQFVFI